MAATTTDRTPARVGLGRLGRVSGVGAALAVLLVLPYFMSPSETNLMVLICINVIAAVGLSLLFGYAGQISLAQAGIMGLGAYTSAILSTRAGLPFWLTLVCAGLVPGVLAYAIGRPILRLRGYYLAMATVAIGGILDTLFEQLNGLTGGFNGIVGIPSPSIGGWEFDQPGRYYYLALAAALLAVLFAWNLTRSRVGRAMRAIRETETGASVMGVNVPALKAGIFALSAVFAGLAGSLYAHYALFISPETFTVSQSVTLLLILAIGGVGSLGGAVIGAILLTMLPQWLRSFGEYDNVLYGALVVLVIMFLPTGIWGALRTLWGAASTRLRRAGRSKARS
jgi:branched-chain amino acid transport system permease protein